MSRSFKSGGQKGIRAKHWSSSRPDQTSITSRTNATSVHGLDTVEEGYVEPPTGHDLRQFVCTSRNTGCRSPCAPIASTEQGEFSAGVCAPVVYGSGLSAWIVYLTYGICCLTRDCVQLLSI